MPSSTQSFGNKNLSFEITGSKELERKLRAMGPAAMKACAGSLYRSAEKVMTLSKQQFVPVDTGNLRASGHVQLPKNEGNVVTVQLGFGGTAGSGNVGETNKADVGYAIPVHENPDARHTVGSYKYLERPLKNSLRDIGKDLVDDLEEAFETLA